jgi:acyl dehydratase
MSGPLYLEDLHPGDVFETQARTVTEADVVGFAQLTGDWNPIHTDVEFAKRSPYGERLAHGMLGMSFAIGLVDRTGLFSGSAIANLGVEEWRFVAPVFIGDTIRVRLEIGDVRATSDGKRGIVGRLFTLLNQRDEAVQHGRIPIMIRLRPAPAAIENAPPSLQPGQPPSLSAPE